MSESKRNTHRQREKKKRTNSAKISTTSLRVNYCSSRPKISSPFSSDVLNYNQTIDQDSIIIEGYRVQVLATRERFKAEKLQSDLEELFEYKIYVIFEAPNYKVRIGDFIDRQKAEKFRKKLSGNGYSSAWIIRTKIDSINN